MPKITIEAHEQRDGRWRVVVPVALRQEVGQRTFWYRGKGAKNAAQKKARELQESRDDIGATWYSLSKSDQALLFKLVARAGSVQSVWEAVEYCESRRPDKETSLAEVIKLAVRSKEQSGMTAHWTKCFEAVCEQFAAKREAMPVSAIQTSHIEAWINQNPKWSQATKLNYLRNLIALFSFAQERGFCKDNPAKKVPKPVQTDTSPTILSVTDAEKLMRNAEQNDRALIPYLALCLFGGLRPSEAVRITKENIKGNHVEVFGKRVRARNRRLVTINKTLGAWLALGGELEPPTNLRKRMRAVSKGIAWKQDCMRHSFVSYHYAIHGAGVTAREAGHSEAVLFNHYRAIATVDAATKFFSILPKPLRSD